MEVTRVGTFDVSAVVLGTGLDTEAKWFLPFLGILAILLEVWLARREKWWPGLLLPGAVLLWAAGCFLLSYSAVSAFLEEMGIGTLMLVRVFLRNNLPTLILLAVYGFCRWHRRRKLRRKRELDAMRVDDL